MKVIAAESLLHKLQRQSLTKTGVALISGTSTVSTLVNSEAGFWVQATQVWRSLLESFLWCKQPRPLDADPRSKTGLFPRVFHCNRICRVEVSDREPVSDAPRRSDQGSDSSHGRVAGQADLLVRRLAANEDKLSDLIVQGFDAFEKSLKKLSALGRDSVASDNHLKPLLTLCMDAAMQFW